MNRQIIAGFCGGLSLGLMLGAVFIPASCAHSELSDRGSGRKPTFDQVQDGPPNTQGAGTRSLKA